MDAIAKTLTEEYTDFKIANPKVRIREAAKALGTNEAALLATQNNVIRLQGPWADLYKQLPTVGRVMSLTRNEGAVLEHKGVFGNMDLSEHMGTAQGPIETRVFFRFWAFGFAAETPTGHGVMKNLQFFDKAGNAITKIYLQPEGSEEAFKAIVQNFTAAEQKLDIGDEIQEIPAPQYADAAVVNQAEFRAEWLALKDTHEFFGILRKHKLNRLDACNLAGSDLAYPFDKSKLEGILSNCAATDLPIMVFVSNPGNIQIHHGDIMTVKMMDKWLNILDPDFNMHLNLDSIAEAWVVKKPTADGEVTSLECFDKAGEMIIQFFGNRKPGTPELQGWKEAVKSL